MPSLPFVFVILVNWNGKDHTLECLHSLEKNLYPHFAVLVVDNGSQDGSVEAIRAAFPEDAGMKVHVLELGENRGFAEGNNRGIAYALANHADSVLLLNNDTVIDPSLLEELVSSAKAHPKVGILGAQVYQYHNRTTLDHLGGRWNEKTARFDLVGLHAPAPALGDLQENALDYIYGCALFIKKEVVEKIGFLEKKFFLLWEEADFCWRAKKAGFHLLVSPVAKLWHKGSASFVGGKPHLTYFWWRNRFLWIERNYPKAKKWRLFCKVLFPELFHIYKLRVLKTVQLYLRIYFLRQASHHRQREKCKYYRASLQGALDFWRGRFGNAPDWILQAKD